MGSSLMAVVAEGEHGRAYVAPSAVQTEAADVPVPLDAPRTKLPEKALSFRVQVYGMDEHWKLFTPRQLTALTTFSGLVKDAQEQVRLDAVASGMADDGVGLADGGTGATAYGEAVGVYLAIMVDRLSNRCCTLCGWDTGREGITQVFGRQALPMVWDYAEGNPFSESTGCFESAIKYPVKVMAGLP